MTDWIVQSVIFYVKNYPKQPENEAKVPETYL